MLRINSIVLGFFLLLAPLSTPLADPGSDSQVDVFALFDLRKGNFRTFVLYNLPSWEAPGCASTLVPELNSQFAIELKAIKLPEEIKRCESTRLKVEPGQRIRFVSISDEGTQAKLEITQSERKTELEKNLVVLKKVITKVAGVGTNESAACLPVIQDFNNEKDASYIQVRIRETSCGEVPGFNSPPDSNISGETPTNQLPDSGGEAAFEIDPSRVVDAQPLREEGSISSISSVNGARLADTKSENSINFVSGPTEKIFLTADILVDSTTELTYDPETGDLKEKDKPTDFYLGINYLLGDLLYERYKALAVQRVFFKGMIKIGKDPLESYGFGIGYRPKFLPAASLFVAYVVSKEDEIQDGSLDENGGRSEEVRVGISLNLDRALEWLQ